MNEIAELLQEAVRSHQKGDLAVAGRLYADVLHRAPESADAWHLSGVMALQLGRTRQAIDQISLSLKLQPEMVDAWANLAAAQLEYGDADAAISSCEKGLQLHPQDGRSHMLLGNAWRHQGHPHRALPHYRSSLQCDDSNALAWCNYGVGLFECGKLESACDALNRAIKLAPQLIPAHVNLGATLRRLGMLEEAEHHLLAAIELSPTDVEAKVNLANLRRDQLRFAEAAALAESVIREYPLHAKAWNLIGLSLQDQGHLPEAIRAFERAAELAPEKFVSCLLYAISLAHAQSPETVAAQHRQWAGRLPAPDNALVRPPVYAKTSLRIGLLSGDFCRHAIATFLLPLLRNLDQQKFPVHCFSERESPDEVTKEFHKIAAAWTNTCGLSDEALAYEIREQQVDILIDLAGHTARNRLAVMNWRPALIQMSYLGYPNTTGLESVDYYLTDAIRDPEGSEVYYTEELLRFPSGANCYEAPSDAPTVNELPALTASGLTFGSMHRLSKLNESVLRLWSRLLRSTNGSRILIVRDGLREDKVRDDLKRRLTSANIDLSRVALAWDWEQTHLEHYLSMDVLLPVSPWGGGTTTYESMWMGVPPLVIRSGRPAEKAAVAALHRVGLESVVVDSESELIARCQTWQLEHLQDIRASLRERMRTSMCDAKTFALEFQNQLLTAWERHVTLPSSDDQ